MEREYIRRWANTGESCELVGVLGSNCALQVRRGTLDADGNASVLGGAGSHLLTAYARSTVLIHLPAGLSPLPPGTLVDVWRIDD